MLQLCTPSEAILREMCQTDIVEERLGKNDKSFASSENLNEEFIRKEERKSYYISRDK